MARRFCALQKLYGKAPQTFAVSLVFELDAFRQVWRFPEKSEKRISFVLNVYRLHSMLTICQVWNILRIRDISFMWKISQLKFIYEDRSSNWRVTGWSETFFLLAVKTDRCESYDIVAFEERKGSWY